MTEFQYSFGDEFDETKEQYHEEEWTVEEDALAFLTDVGLVGRLTMSQQAGKLNLNLNIS